ncbi:MAG: hypothetical protein ABR538_05290 [Candidatus Binatia bacterium]
MNASAPQPIASRRVPATRTAMSLLLLAGIVMLSSCALETAPRPCRRLDIGSMGEENGFRLAIGTENALMLATDKDHLDLAITVVPPIKGNVVLVQSDGDREMGRWELPVPPGNGISTRCRLGTTPGGSTCGATITDRPHPVAGTWSLEAGGNRVLEAGVAVYVCP